MYFQDIMNFISDCISVIFKTNFLTEEILHQGDDFRIRSLKKFKLNQLKQILRSFLITDYRKDSESLERINELMISEFDSLRFSNDLSVGIKNVIEDIISESNDFPNIIRKVHLSVCNLIHNGNKSEITSLLNFNGISESKTRILSQLVFQKFSKMLKKNFEFESRRDKLKFDFFVQTQFQDRDNKLQIDYRSMHNSELFTGKGFENIQSLSKIPDLVMNLWRFSYLSVEEFRTKIRKKIISELISRIPKKINIELVEIKYKILKKDPLDELFISEYYNFNKNINKLRDLLQNALGHVDLGINSCIVKYLMNGQVPESWKTQIFYASFIFKMTKLLDFFAQQKEYFLMIIEKNYKFLFDLKFFKNPKKTLKVAKQVISKKMRKTEESLKEEYKIYDTVELDNYVAMDIENGKKDRYFIKGLNLVGCKLHYVDQKLTEDQGNIKGLFTEAPFLMVRFVLEEETERNFLVKFHSLPVYRCLPKTLKLQQDLITPSLKNPQVCVYCLQFFCNNIQYFNITDENFMKLIYELRGRLSSNTCFNFYRLQDIPPAFSKILVNLNQICVHREEISNVQEGNGVGIISTDDINDFFLLSLRFPTIEKENYWIKKMAYAVLSVPFYFKKKD